MDLVIGERNIERIVDTAKIKIEQLGDAASIRHIHDDWIRKFFRYAADVDDERLRGIFADILANIVIDEYPLIPLKAIDIVRFMDKEKIEQFLYIGKYISKYGFILESNVINLSNHEFVKRDILDTLEEIQLLKRVYVYNTSIQIGSLLFSIGLDVGSTFRFDIFKFTQIGAVLIDILDKNIKSINANKGKPSCVDAVWNA